MQRCSAAPYEGSQYYIFVSYSHKDSDRAIQIMEQLDREGYRLWYDEGIDPGSEWPETIANHLGGASACIGLISGNYLTSHNKALKIALLALAAVVLFFVLLIIIVSIRNNRKYDMNNTSAAQTETLDSLPTFENVAPLTEAEIMEVPDTPVDKEILLIDNSLAGRLLWGKKTPDPVYSTDPNDFIKKTSFMDISLESGVINVSILPYAIEARADDHPEILRLYYYDKVGTEHIVQASFTICRNILFLFPCERVFEDAETLQERLTYDITMSSGKLTLESKELYATMRYCSESEGLRGAADSAVIREIGALEILHFNEGAECTVLFTDGGRTKDAIVAHTWDNTNSVKLQWTQEQRLYNGQMADFDVEKSYIIEYYNTYPYGFVLIDSKEVYFYQKPFPSETEETGRIG